VHSEGFAFASFTPRRPAQRAGLSRRTAGWGQLAERFVNCCQHAVQISVYLVVPEAKHAKSIFFQSMVTPEILCSMLIEIMLASVDFHHQAVPHAYEVDNVSLSG
jgi:hypothetical protein